MSKLRWQAFVSAICISIAVAACAQTPSEDVRRDVYDPSAFQARNLQAWEQFNAAHDNRWRVTWNPVTGTPSRIRGHVIPVDEDPTDRNVEAVSRRLLAEYRAVLQADPQNLSFVKADFFAPKRPGSGAGSWHVSFRQVHQDLPVYGGSVRLVIRNRNLTNLAADYYPGIDIPVDTRVPLADATTTVRSDMMAVTALEPIETTLLVFPRPLVGQVQYHLAWQITMPITVVPAEQVRSPDRPRDEGEGETDLEPVQWRDFVDAQTGRVLDRINILATADLSGTVTGMVRPLYDTDTPEPRPLSNLTIELSQGGASVPPAQTNADGAYVFQGLADGPAEVEARLKGPHVIVTDAETPGADSLHTAMPTVPGAHSWNWAADDTSPNDVATNVFYHVNWIREWFLQIDPDWGNPEPHPLPVKVRATILGKLCNAGASDSGLIFGKGDPGECADFGFCTDVIYHEYTHRVVQKAYDDSKVPLPYEGLTGAMNEGWADYFATSVTQDPTIIEKCWPDKIRIIDTPDKRYPDDWVEQVHMDGMIFSGALWDIRAVLGSAYVDALALRAVLDVPSTFDQYLAAVLETDDDSSFSADPSANDNPADGTPNIDTICQSYFDLHGIYDPYCAGHTNLPVAFITGPSPAASFNLLDGAAATAPIVGSAAGTATSPLQDYVLEYAHASAPDVWVAFGGGTAPVDGDVLGELDLSDAAAFPDGFYVVRLTVNTVDGQSATALTSLVIDRLLMTGWPQEVGTYSWFFRLPAHFRSAAVADLDPDYPGLEVVTQMWARPRLYVWHADGTLASDWPRYGVTGNDTAPVVGDVDADGDYEIVVHETDGTVGVFHHDNTEVAGLWPQQTFAGESLPSQSSTPALADLDADGDLEIVVGSADGKIYAWHHNGLALQGWPVVVGDEIRSSPALGDLDGDGTIEVVINSKDGVVQVLTPQGTPYGGGAPAWPKSLSVDGTYTSAPVLGDLDGDGDLEIVLGAGSVQTFQVFAWHHDGQDVANWPQTFEDSYMSPPASLALADLVGDALPEVVARSRGGKVYAWTGAGAPVPGWSPVTPNFNALAGGSSSPAIADLDGDGDSEVVVDLGRILLHGYASYEVPASHHDGAPVAGWPRTPNSNLNTTPAIADIDQDGDVEVLVGSHGMFVWDLPGSFDSAAAECPFYRQDIRRTGTYGDTAPPIIALVGDAEVEVQACGVYVDAGATAFDDIDGDLTGQIVTDVGGVDTTTAGTYPVTYTVSDGAGNAAVVVTRLVHVVDETPPVISLIGDAEITVPAAVPYQDPGATATNCVDGDLTDAIVSNAGDVNTAVPGTYTVTYTVSDSAGNAAVPVTRTVLVEDVTAPVITLTGPAEVTVEACSVFKVAKATALDDVDGDISLKVAVDFSELDMFVPGAYLITYTVSDDAGNAAAPATQTVIVVDTTAPVIDVKGPFELTIPVGGSYLDPGAIAEDCVDGDSVPEAGSDLDVNTPGTYTVTYFAVTDSAGNTSAPASRIVKVVE